MKTKIKKTGTKRRMILVILAAAVVLVGGTLAYMQWGRSSTVVAQTPVASKTTLAKTGTLIISASGSGTLVAGQQASLSFPVAGTLASLNVQVGDKVTAGQALAQLADLESLQNAVSSAQVNLTTAKQTLADLQNNSGATLGTAQLALADAQKAYDDAKSAVVTTQTVRCDTDTTTAYYDKYMFAKQNYDQLVKRLGNGVNDANTYLVQVKPVKDILDKAYSTYIYCAGFTDYEISSSQATLTKTQAALAAAQKTVDLLTKNNGVDPDQLAVAQNNAATAQFALDTAQKNLDGATLKAPFDGTILSVAGAVGDKVGATAFITLADLAHPNIQFNVDETDMDKVAVGYDATVTFDALPDQTFNGKVTQVDPTLASVNGVKTLKGLIKVDLGTAGAKTLFPAGMTASVEVIGGKAENAVLVPLDALKDLGGGEYGVFIVGADGQPKFTSVKVGLKDLTNAQITEGLKAGDMVTTGIVETK